MASPFSVFRKNQKVLIVVVGILCMIAFLILPSVMKMESRRGSRSEIVVTTKYGKIRDPELAVMLRNRNLVNLFLREAVLTTVAVMRQENPLPVSETQMVQFKLSRLQQQGLLGPATDEAVVDTMILARRSQEMGLVVSDQAINDFLRVVTENKVSGDQFNSILKRIQTSSGRVFEALRTELLAIRLREIFVSGLQPSPPAERFAYYKRLKQQATIEAAALPVANFAGTIADPDDVTLKDYFERYKNVFADPRSPEPGFRQPPRVALQYFQADYEKFVENVSVTDQEVEQYYQDHKEEFRNKSNRPLGAMPIKSQNASPPGNATDDGSSDKTEENAAEQQNEETKDDKGPSTDHPGSAGEPATSGSGNNSADASDKGPASRGMTFDLDSLADDPEKSIEKSPAEPASESPHASSDSETKPPLEPAEPAIGPKASTEKTPAADKTSGEPDGGSSKTTEKTPDKTSSAGDDSSTGKSTPDDSGAAPSSESGATTVVPLTAYTLPSEYVLPLNIRDLPLWDYEPLWSLRDGKTLRERIAERLKRERVGGKVDKIFVKLTEQVNQYKYRWEDWQDAKLDSPQLAPPKPLDLAELAAAYEGISVHETGLLSKSELRQSTDLGSSFLTGGTPLTEYVFQPGRLYSPGESVDLAGNRYLFWKAEETAEKIPTFDEARQQVLEAWKLVQAREPARAAAERLLEKAKSDGKPLAQSLSGEAGVTVLTAGPFSWMHEPSFQNQMRGMRLPTLSAVDGIEAPGDEFMRTVFQLEEGQYDVAMNAPQMIVYVVRVKKLSPTEKVLQTTFLVDDFRRFAGVAVIDRFKIQQRWIEEIKQEAGVHWVRSPDTAIRR